MRTDTSAGRQANSFAGWQVNRDSSAGRQIWKQFRRQAGMETVSQAGRYGNSFAGRQVWKQFRRQAGGLR